jgi:uncharacterized pyridoxamine 5'-phosphate oxidase family protein
MSKRQMGLNVCVIDKKVQQISLKSQINYTRNIQVKEIVNVKK